MHGQCIVNALKVSRGLITRLHKESIRRADVTLTDFSVTEVVRRGLKAYSVFPEGNLKSPAIVFRGAIRSGCTMGVSVPTELLKKNEIAGRAGKEANRSRWWGRERFRDFVTNSRTPTGRTLCNDGRYHSAVFRLPAYILVLKGKSNMSAKKRKAGEKEQSFLQRTRGTKVHSLDYLMLPLLISARTSKDLMNLLPL